MNKAVILLILVAVIAAQSTFMKSFYIVTDGGSTTDTSAVIVAKANYLSVRVKFSIIVYPPLSSTVTLHFSDGSQKNITSSYVFEVFLPRNGSSFGSFAANTPAGTISDRNPINIAVLSNVTENFITNQLTSDQDDTVTLFWFEIQGKARVFAGTYGVAV